MTSTLGLLHAIDGLYESVVSDPAAWYEQALADWAKVMIGLVIPLLIIAAIIEVWITPRVAMWLL